METIGGWSEKASHTITLIGRLLGQCLGSNSEDTTSHLFQCLSRSLYGGVILPRGSLVPPPPLLLLMVSYNSYNNTIQGASVTPGYAITVREDRKFRIHLENCLAAGVSFVPLVVESLGGWSDEAIDTLRLIGKQQAQRMGLPPSHSINHLFKRLSIVLWHRNACMWASRMPIHLPSEDGIE